jgi:hypothetical protein
MLKPLQSEVGANPRLDDMAGKSADRAQNTARGMPKDFRLTFILVRS